MRREAPFRFDLVTSDHLLYGLVMRQSSSKSAGPTFYCLPNDDATILKVCQGDPWLDDKTALSFSQLIYTCELFLDAHIATNCNRVSHCRGSCDPPLTLPSKLTTQHEAFFATSSFRGSSKSSAGVSCELPGLQVRTERIEGQVDERLKPLMAV